MSARALAVERHLANGSLSKFERLAKAGAVLSAGASQDAQVAQRAFVVLYETPAPGRPRLSAKAGDVVELIRAGSCVAAYADYIEDVINNHRDRFFTLMDAPRRYAIFVGDEPPAKVTKLFAFAEQRRCAPRSAPAKI